MLARSRVNPELPEPIRMSQRMLPQKLKIVIFLLFLAGTASLAAEQGREVVVLKEAELRIGPDPSSEVLRKVIVGEFAVLLNDEELRGAYNVSVDGVSGWLPSAALKDEQGFMDRDVRIPEIGETVSGGRTSGATDLEKESTWTFVGKFAENGRPGEILVAQSRVIEPRPGVSLASVVFKLQIESSSAYEIYEIELDCEKHDFRMTAFSRLLKPGVLEAFRDYPPFTTRFTHIASDPFTSVENFICDGRTNFGHYRPEELEKVDIKILSAPRPGMTNQARAAANGGRYSGQVVLRVTFLGTGEIGPIEIIEGLPYGLTKKAISAAKKIKFKPKTVGGLPVTVSKLITFNFTVY